MCASFEDIKGFEVDYADLFGTNTIPEQHDPIELATGRGGVVFYSIHFLASKFSILKNQRNFLKILPSIGRMPRHR